MVASAVFMALAGTAATFLPEELLVSLDVPFSPALSITFQIMGALYLGFAMMNWMAKDVLVGGIYARPLAIGNFAHFMIAAIALLKAAYAMDHSWLWIVAVIYSIFALLFGVVTFTHPGR